MLWTCDAARAFLVPVKTTQVQDYYIVVKDPMFLQYMKVRALEPVFVRTLSDSISFDSTRLDSF